MDENVDVEFDALAEEKSEPAPLPPDSDAQHEEESAKAQEKPKQPQRLAFKRAERRRLQRIVVKGIARRRKKRKQSKPRLGPHDFVIEWTKQQPTIEPARPPYRAARRAMQRFAARAMRKQIRGWQRQMPLLCPRCQQPYLGPSGWRCACKAERDVEFVAAE